jgi:hypothetical protein
MDVVVAILVIAVVGAASFVTKAIWFKAMAELWKRPPQLRSASGDSTDWLEVQQRKVTQLPAGVRDAHNHASNHPAEVLASARCGCFYCGATFSPHDIEAWTDDVNGEGQTALCPRCSVDAVLGDRAGYELSSSFLQHMKSVWF